MNKVFAIVPASRRTAARRAIAAAATAVAGFAGSAHAALPTVITEKLAEAGTDLETAAGALIATMLGFWALRTVGKKLGWWG